MFAACKQDEFTCVADGFCIPSTLVCNLIPECEDGSDELNCGEFSTLNSAIFCTVIFLFTQVLFMQIYIQVTSILGIFVLFVCITRSYTTKDIDPKKQYYGLIFNCTVFTSSVPLLLFS